MQGILVRQVVLRPGLQPIEAIRLPDGSKGASVRSICMVLDLSRQGQVQRIKRTPELAVRLTLVSLATPKGLRVFDVLPSRAIPPWLLGTDTGRLAPHKQELITFIKEGIIEAIERAFSDGSPEAPVEAPPMLDAWGQEQEEREAIAASTNQLHGVLTSFHQRLLVVERAQHVEITLDMMPERMAHLFAVARARKAATSIPITDTLAALAAQFGVEEIADIPAVQWPEVVTTLEGYIKQDMQTALDSQLVTPSITPERLAALRAMPYEEYLRTPEWRARRQEALKRAQYRCYLCNTNQSPLEVHHRTYERLGAEAPEDLYVLCDSCHQWYHRKPGAPTRRA